MNQQIWAEQYCQALQQFLSQNQKSVPWGLNKKKETNTEEENEIYVPTLCLNLGIIELVKMSRITKNYFLIYLANIKNTLDHENAIAKLLQRYPKINYAIFLDCQISQTVLSILCKTASNFQFIGCQLGNQTIFKQKMFNKNIALIKIKSDSFGNQGLKRLISLDLPQLEKMVLSNTNITTDCIKTFNKKQFEVFTKLLIKNQVYFNFGQFLKNYHCKYGRIMACFHYQKGCFVYLNHASKFICNSFTTNLFSFFFQKPIVYPNSKPIDTIQILQYSKAGQLRIN